MWQEQREGGPHRGRKEEGNSKEKEDKDSSWTCVVGLVDGGGTSLVVQLGEHSCKSYDNQTGGR